MHKANCNTFNFSCRAKQDTYNVRQIAIIAHHNLTLYLGNDAYPIWDLSNPGIELQRRGDGYEGLAVLPMGQVVL
jgi:hypothetical protein